MAISPALASAGRIADARPAAGASAGEDVVEALTPRLLRRTFGEARLEAVGGERIGLRSAELGQRRERGDEVVVDVAAEVGGVVGIDGRAQARFEQLNEAVIGHLVIDAQLHIREWADRQRRARS